MLIRVVYLYYSVCCDGEVFIEYEGYGVAYLDVLRVGFLDVYQGSCVVGGLHGAGEHAVGLEADDFGSYQQCCGDDYYRHHDCCYDIVDLPAFALLTSSSQFFTFRFRLRVCYVRGRMYCNVCLIFAGRSIMSDREGMCYDVLL